MIFLIIAGIVLVFLGYSVGSVKPNRKAPVELPESPIHTFKITGNQKTLLELSFALNSGRLCHYQVDGEEQTCTRNNCIFYLVTNNRMRNGNVKFELIDLKGMSIFKKPSVKKSKVKKK